MNKKSALLILVAIGIVATLRPTTNITAAAGTNFKSGAVYVLTNQVSNAVTAFDRAPYGTLTSAGTFSTGGAGNPVAQPGDPPTDPLASQGALILSDNAIYTFLQTGLQTVEAFSVAPDGSLTKIDSVGGLPFGTQGIAAR